MHKFWNKMLIGFHTLVWVLYILHVVCLIHLSVRCTRAEYKYISVQMLYSHNLIVEHAQSFLRSFNLGERTTLRQPQLLQYFTFLEDLSQIYL